MLYQLNLTITKFSISQPISLKLHFVYVIGRFLLRGRKLTLHFADTVYRLKYSMVTRVYPTKVSSNLRTHHYCTGYSCVVEYGMLM